MSAGLAEYPAGTRRTTGAGHHGRLFSVPPRVLACAAVALNVAEPVAAESRTARRSAVNRAVRDVAGHLVLRAEARAARKAGLPAGVWLLRRGSPGSKLVGAAYTSTGVEG
ncbi:hypothetical protein [Streptomyces sp. NPDC054804]